jgi:integrase
MRLVKRGNVWWMDLIHDGIRIRRSTGTSDKEQAEGILANLRVELGKVKFFEHPREKQHTFEEMMGRYLKECSAYKSPKSAVRDRGALNHLLPVFGDMVITGITPKLLAGYKTQRRLERAAPATINKELQLVRHAFNLGREWEWCQDNPMQRVSMEKTHNEVDRWLTLDEEDRLMTASSPWLREFIVFALNTGMRQGEILNLQWQDVDFTRGTLVVMKSKNGTRRTLPLNTTVYELLATKQASMGVPRGRVFTTPRRNELKVRFLAREFCEARDRAGIPDFRFHDLRHTFATRLVQRGIDLYKVQRLLGHKTTHMTQRYAHHSPESLREGVRILENSSRLAQFSDTIREASQGEVCNPLK